MISSATSDAFLDARLNPRLPWVVWGSIAFLSLLFSLLIIAAPVVANAGYPEFASSIYKFFSFLCHQIPERSFHIAGYQFAACSRCAGLYSGFALATVGFPLVRSLRKTDTPSIVWLFLSALPLAIDFSLTYFGVWQNNHFTRFATGGLFGVVAAIYVVPGLIELSTNLKKRLRRNSASVDCDTEVN